ncbi:MAG TPA: hypothetical protein VGD31_16680 [Sphingobacteriaceae bacterium]
MSEQGKKWFLAICIAVPFLVYCVYYYGIMIKNAPYKFSEFESLTLKYGLGTDLVNQYNSKTGEYQYLNERDSLIKTKVKLTKDDLLYLHRKAADLGFWNFPEKIEGRPDPKHPVNTPHYYLEYKYERKDKHMLFDLNYSDDPKLHTAAKTLIDEVSKTIIDAKQRGK